MGTSLAEQLKRLAVPQTSLLQRDKKRPSLLFDPKEAANLGKETVYQIGVDGLEELKSRNSVFAQFENTLFHITSKEFERAVETAESNQRLNKNIRKFLLLLSPYFLLNCSYKALEWLVYRYHIHEYNKEDILALILPYHETNIFVRALQLINVKEPNDKWHWLKSLQKPGVHLPKLSLYTHAASNVYFLEFVSNYVLLIIKEHEKPTSLSVVFNFYCTTFTGALEYSQQITEPQVSQMLPVILKGLTSDIPDFAAASYVITAKLFTKSQLSEKILERFVEKLAQINVRNLQSEAVLVLVILYQSQKQFVKFSEIAMQHLCTRGGLGKTLENLNSDGIYIYSIVQPLLQSAIFCVLNKEDLSEDCMKFVDCLIADVKIDDSYVDSLMNAILDIYHQKPKYPAKTVEWLKKFVHKIETQYPAAFDLTVQNIMATTKDPTRIEQQKTLRKLVHNLTNIQDSFELFEKLYHPNSKIRVEGLKILSKKFKILKEKDARMLENALLDRLNDDSLEVVNETLRLFKPKFSEVLQNMNVLKNILLRLLIKSQTNTHWENICCAALDVLCQHFVDSDIDIFFGVLPFLLPSNENDMRAARQIVISTYALKSIILRPLRETLLKITKPNQFSEIINATLETNTKLPDVQSLVPTLKAIEDHALFKHLGMLLLSSRLSDDSEPEISCLLLDVFEIYVGLTKMTVIKGNSDPFDFIMLARKNKFTLQGFLYCVENVIRKTKKPEEIATMDLSSGGDFYLRLLKIFVKGCCSSKEKKSGIYARALRGFLKVCDVKTSANVEFLLNVSICENALVQDDFRIGCLKIVDDLVSEQENNTDLLGFHHIVVPSILVGLNMPNVEFRHVLFKIIEKLATNAASNYNYGALLNELVQNQEEILLDHEQIPLVLFNVLSVTTDLKLNAIKSQLIQLASEERFPIYLKSGLMSLLTYLNDTNIYEKTCKIAITILEKNKGKSEQLTSSESEIVVRNLQRFDSSIVGNLDTNSAIWEFFKLSLFNDTVLINNKTKNNVPSILLLNQIDRDLFSCSSSTLRPIILDLIIDVATTSQNPEVLQAAGQVFKKIDLDCELVLRQLRDMRDIQSKLKEAKRRRRVEIIPTVDILDMIQWKKGVTILEFMQDKKKIRNSSLIISVLFEVLKKCLEFDEQASVEYPKQLLLSTILRCCDKIEDETLPENAFNMQLVVQCVRASQNPQTHHHALLVLAKTATLIPKQVLHHIIAIFTFVGSSVLRHDDAYSFQIISKIIDTIIPILIQDGSPESVEKVLRVFVDAILDIPEHRRMPLFKQLLSRLDPKTNLHLFLLIVFEAHVVHEHLEKQKTYKNRSSINIDEAPKRLDIAADLSREFSVEIVLGSCIKILEYIRKLPEEKNDNDNRFVFDTKSYTAKQFRHYKYTIITFVPNLLASTKFINQVAALTDEEMLRFEGLFKELILNTLNYIQETSKVAERNAHTAQAQYWKVILHHSYDTLDAINALLTNQMFLLVIRGLMVYSLSTVRKRALELLNNKLQHDSSFSNQCDPVELYNVIVTPLLNIISGLERPNMELEQELIVQKALFSLKLLVKCLGAENPEKFVPILKLISDLVKVSLGKVHDNTLASLILCLSELASTLRAHAISNLNKFMPTLIKLLKSQKRLEAPTLLLVSNITALHKILDSLPLFLSPYLEKLLYEVSLLACKWDKGTESKLAPFFTKLQSIQQKFGSVIPLRVLLPAIERSYNNLIDKRAYPAVGPLIAVLSENLSNMKGSEIQANLPELTKFFLNALQFRTDSQSSHEQAEEVEGYVIKALVSLILKLSESSFRPLYYKLFDWAVRTDAKSERVITFYNLSRNFAKCLKGLFVLFAGHFFNNAASLLDALNSSKTDRPYFDDDKRNVALLEKVLETLHLVFLYDCQKFVTKERFDVLMQPVVDQLENILGGVECFERRAKFILTPAIVQFSIATADDALWKQMNYQILLKTRHNSPNIRLVALECLGETAKKLGEDFLPLLPETIPFLAELLEDEEEKVEKACQRTVQELEKVLGEPLQKYF